MHKNNAEDNVASHSHTKPHKEIFHEIKWDVAMSWQLRGRQLWEISGCYRVYVATCK